MMDAGRELEIRVAKALNWTTEHQPPNLWSLTAPDGTAEGDWLDMSIDDVWSAFTPHFGTDWAAWSRLVETLRALWAWQLSEGAPHPTYWEFVDYGARGWQAGIMDVLHDVERYAAVEQAETLPLATVRAAAKYLGC